MVNCQSSVKSRKRKAALLKAMPGKAVAVKSHPGHRKTATALVYSMNLDEMLEASKVIEMGMKGEKIPTVKSSKAQRYAGITLQLNEKSDTKTKAEKMRNNLNARIIEVNKKTTDAAESKRLYHELMAKE